jgi:hypothetical protein
MFTARHKGFCLVNVHPTIKFVAKLGLMHMPPKLRNRSKIYSCFEELDIIEKEKLPIECGGEVAMDKFIGKQFLL